MSVQKACATLVSPPCTLLATVHLADLPVVDGHPCSPYVTLKVGQSTAETFIGVDGAGDVRHPLRLNVEEVPTVVTVEVWHRPPPSRGSACTLTADRLVCEATVTLTAASLGAGEKWIGADPPPGVIHLRWHHQTAQSLPSTPVLTPSPAKAAGAGAVAARAASEKRKRQRMSPSRASSLVAVTAALAVSCTSLEEHEDEPDLPTVDVTLQWAGSVVGIHLDSSLVLRTVDPHLTEMMRFLVGHKLRKVNGVTVHTTGEVRQAVAGQSTARFTFVHPSQPTRIPQLESLGLDTSMGIACWKIVGRGGATVRTTESLQSRPIALISPGTTVGVAQARGRRVYIVVPIPGWISTVDRSGKPIAVKVPREKGEAAKLVSLCDECDTRPAVLACSECGKQQCKPCCDTTHAARTHHATPLVSAIEGTAVAANWGDFHWAAHQICSRMRDKAVERCQAISHRYQYCWLFVATKEGNTAIATLLDMYGTDMDTVVQRRWGCSKAFDALSHIRVLADRTVTSRVMGFPVKKMVNPRTLHPKAVGPAKAFLSKKVSEGAAMLASSPHPLGPVRSRFSHPLTPTTSPALLTAILLFFVPGLSVSAAITLAQEDALQQTTTVDPITFCLMRVAALWCDSIGEIDIFAELLGCLVEGADALAGLWRTQEEQSEGSSPGMAVSSLPRPLPRSPLHRATREKGTLWGLLGSDQWRPLLTKPPADEDDRPSAMAVAGLLPPLKSNPDAILRDLVAKYPDPNTVISIDDPNPRPFPSLSSFLPYRRGLPPGEFEDLCSAVKGESADRRVVRVGDLMQYLQRLASPQHPEAAEDSFATIDTGNDDDISPAPTRSPSLSPKASNLTQQASLPLLRSTSKTPSQSSRRSTVRSTSSRRMSSRQQSTKSLAVQRRKSSALKKTKADPLAHQKAVMNTASEKTMRIFERETLDWKTFEARLAEINHGSLLKHIPAFDPLSSLHAEHIRVLLTKSLPSFIDKHSRTQLDLINSTLMFLAEVRHAREVVHRDIISSKTVSIKAIPCTSIELTQPKHGQPPFASVRFFLQDSSLAYTVNKIQKPKVNEVHYHRLEHTLTFPGHNKKVWLPQDDLVKLLGKLRFLLQSAGLHHDIPSSIVLYKYKPAEETFGTRAFPESQLRMVLQYCHVKECTKLTEASPKMAPIAREYLTSLLEAKYRDKGEEWYEAELKGAVTEDECNHLVQLEKAGKLKSPHKVAIRVADMLCSILGSTLQAAGSWTKFRILLKNKDLHRALMEYDLSTFTPTAFDDCRTAKQHADEGIGRHQEPMGLECLGSTWVTITEENIERMAPLMLPLYRWTKTVMEYYSRYAGQPSHAEKYGWTEPAPERICWD